VRNWRERKSARSPTRIGDALVKFVIAKKNWPQLGIRDCAEEPISHGAAAELEALLSGTVDAVVGTRRSASTRSGMVQISNRFRRVRPYYALGGIAARRDYVENNAEIHTQIRTAM